MKQLLDNCAKTKNAPGSAASPMSLNTCSRAAGPAIQAGFSDLIIEGQAWSYEAEIGAFKSSDTCVIVGVL